MDDNTAMHLYLYGLKEHVQAPVMLQLPSTFEELVMLAERADQAFMASHKKAPDSQPRGNRGSRGHSGGHRGGHHGGRGGNSGHRGGGQW